MMDWFKVLCFVIVIDQLDGFQNQIASLNKLCESKDCFYQSQNSRNQGAEQTVVNNEVDVPNINTANPCSTTVDGCRNSTHIVLHFNNIFNQTISFIKDLDLRLGCYMFDKVNDSFIAEIVENPSGDCAYNLVPDLDLPILYYIDGVDLSQLRSQCPTQEKVCVTDILESCYLPNFRVTTVTQMDYGEYQYRNLKLSWDQVNSSDAIGVEFNEMDTNEGNCLSRDNLNVFNHSIHDNVILVPNMLTDDEVYPGCTYEISVYSKTRKRERIRCSVTYTVPKGCENFEQFPEILSVEFVSGEMFLVHWDPGKISGEVFEGFSNVSFKYGLDTLSSAEIVKNDIKEHTSEVLMRVFGGKHYILVGTLSNGFCTVEFLEYYFTAPEESFFFATVAISVGVIVLAVVIIIVNYKYISKYKNKLSGILTQRGTCRGEEMVKIQNKLVPINDIPEADKYEVSRDQIVIKEVIGNGAFGQVCSAKAVGAGGIQGHILVAVKTLGDRGNVTQEATDDFMAEMEIFKKIGKHPNVVTLLGYCTKETPYMMIMELVPCGDLKTYLVELKSEWFKRNNVPSSRQFFFPDNSDDVSMEPVSPVSPVSPAPSASIRSSRLPSNTETAYTALDSPMTPLLAHFILDKVLDHTELENFALQIAKGMAHLEQIGVTHRDLAARNVLINEYKVLKISDFGLSRCGPYVNCRTKRLPLRWMAIESIANQKYDSKSDVWSFGVVLWEIGSLGAFPYEKIPDPYLQQFLQLGGRLKRPEICTRELYGVMERCWASDPKERPAFRELVQELDVKKRKIYVDFNQLNPTYVFSFEK